MSTKRQSHDKTKLSFLALVGRATTQLDLM